MMPESMFDQASSVANCGICLVCVKDSRYASSTNQPHAEKKKNLPQVPPNTVPAGITRQSKALSSTAKTQDGRKN
ncbi:MAG: hypothetical protein U0103_08435 [Candidatus Obscuribacterales bacterium]